MTDILVIGAGPAGLTAAIYGARAGLSVTILEQTFAGGQIALTHKLENYPGFPEGISGMEFSEAIRQQAERFGAKIVSADIRSAELDGDIKKVTSTSGEVFEGRSIIIANGAKARTLGIDGEAEFTGQGVSYCATCDGAFFKNATVAVIGGGDTALEDALYLSLIAKKVYIIHRRDEFRAQKVLVDRAKAKDNVALMLSYVPEKFYGGLDFEGVTLKNLKTGESEELPLDGCFVAVGYAPDTAWLPKELKTTENGYIIAEEDCHTNIKGVFVAGDVRTKKTASGSDGSL